MTIYGRNIIIASTERLYTTHLMNALTSHGDDLQEWINYMVNVEGHNMFWLFGDSWYGGSTSSNVMNAINTAGAKFMPGNQTENVPSDNTVLMFTDSFNHAGIYKYNGKPVYHGYAADTLPDAIKTAITNAGYNRNTYQFWIYSGYYPVTVDGITYYLPTPQKSQDVIDLFNSSSDIDGVLDFAVDKPNGVSPLQNIIDENTFLSQGAASIGKVGIAGINHNYASAQYVTFGYDGTLSQIKAILALPLNQWPLGICETTANDGVERSTMSRHQNAAVNGLAFVPNVSAGYTLGPTFSYPLIDNTGLNKFIKPWINKFKASDTSPVVITTDRLFAWYLLHPINADYVTTMPAYLNTNWPAQINGIAKATYWDTTFYHHLVSSPDDKIYGIKTYMPASYANIKMAAHLVSSAYLRIVINGHTYTSSLKSAGDAYFEITQELGTPVFSIIDADGTTVRKTGTGPQQITNNCWPGGWNPLIIEL